MASPTLKHHKDLVGADLHVNKLHADTHHNGGTDPLEYVHNQIVSSAAWDIVHGLGKYPTVVVVDSGDNVVIGDIHYLSANELTITFNGSFSGKAYLT